MYNCTTHKIKFLNQYLINSMFNCNSNSHSNTQYTTTSSSTEYTTPIQNTHQPAPIQNSQLQYTIHNNQLQYKFHNSNTQYTTSSSNTQYTTHRIATATAIEQQQLSPQQLFLHQQNLYTKQRYPHLIFATD